jgi:hypothetical protein
MVFFIGPLSFKTPRGGRVTVFGALLTVPLVLGVNKYLDHKKCEEKIMTKKRKEEARASVGVGVDVAREERPG